MAEECPVNPNLIWYLLLLIDPRFQDQIPDTPAFLLASYGSPLSKRRQLFRSYPSSYWHPFLPDSLFLKAVSRRYSPKHSRQFHPYLVGIYHAPPIVELFQIFS